MLLFDVHNNMKMFPIRLCCRYLVIEAPRKPERPPANERIVPIKVLDTPVTNSPHKSNNGHSKSNGNTVRFKDPPAETRDI